MLSKYIIIISLTWLLSSPWRVLVRHKFLGDVHWSSLSDLRCIVIFTDANGTWQVDMRLWQCIVNIMSGKKKGWDRILHREGDSISLTKLKTEHERCISNWLYAGKYKVLIEWYEKYFLCEEQHSAKESLCSASRPLQELCLTRQFSTAPIKKMQQPNDLHKLVETPPAVFSRSFSPSVTARRPV